MNIESIKSIFMWPKNVRRQVGLASGLAGFDPMLEGRRVIEVLLNSNADKDERSQAISQMQTALDSLILDLEV